MAYPGPGQFNDRAMMNGGQPPRHPSDNMRYNNHGSPDFEPHYSHPYAGQQQQQQQQQQPNMGFNGSNIQNGNNKTDNKTAIHRPRLNRKNEPDEKGKSSLTTNFDPMKDRHMWAMWRTAVNGRIVDQVRKNEQFKHDAMLPPDEFSSAAGESDARASVSTYGKDLASQPPLSRFIRLNQKSKHIAQELMNEGQGKLETSQFIYYGLPRVTVNTSHNNRYVHHHQNNNSFNNNNSSNNNSFSNDKNNHNNHNNDFNVVQNGHNHPSNGYGNTNFYRGGFEHPVQDY